MLSDKAWGILSTNRKVLHLQNDHNHSQGQGQQSNWISRGSWCLVVGVPLHLSFIKVLNWAEVANHRFAFHIFQASKRFNLFLNIMEMTYDICIYRIWFNVLIILLFWNCDLMIKWRYIKFVHILILHILSFLDQDQRHTWESDILRGVSNTVQITLSKHPGVVRLPL